MNEGWQSVPGTDIGYGSSWVKKTKELFVEAQAAAPLSEIQIDDKAVAEYGPKTEKQRKDLRKVLVLVGAVSMTGVAKHIPHEEGEVYTPGMSFSTEETTESTGVGESVSVIPVAATQQVVHESVTKRVEETQAEIIEEIKAAEEQIAEYDVAETMKYAEKPVRGYEQYTRMQYAQEKLQFRSEHDEKTGRPGLPELLQENLKEAAAGWIAQESRYKGDAVSKSGARGIWQFLKHIGQHYGKSKTISLSMVKQTQMAGELLSDNYHYILHYAGDATMSSLRSRFDSEDAFLTDFMTPVMINSFNAGGPLMGKVLRKFVQETPSDTMKEGRDLFVQVADFAEAHFDNYTQEQRNYVTNVAAWGNKIKKYLQQRSG